MEPGPATHEVRVRFVGMVRRAVGKSEDVVTLGPGSTVGALLDQLTARYGEPFREQVFHGDRLAPSANVFVDGVNCATLGGDGARLGDANEIEVIVFGPPAAGG